MAAYAASDFVLRHRSSAQIVASGVPMGSVVVDFWREAPGSITLDFKLLMPLSQTASVSRLVGAPSFAPFLVSKLRMYGMVGLPAASAVAAEDAALRLSQPVVLRHVSQQQMSKRNIPLPPRPPPTPAPALHTAAVATAAPHLIAAPATTRAIRSSRSVSSRSTLPN